MANPIKPSFKTEWPSVLAIMLTLGAAVYFYRHFPEQVPTHWNLAGQADGFSSAGAAAFLGPIFLLPLYLLFLFLPYLDPRRDRYSEFAAAYHRIKNGLLLFMAAIFLLAGLAGLGYPLNISFWLPILVGVLFGGLGAALRSIKSNWFMGIRTPWTLSSEDVWAETHRAAFPVMAASGLLMAATAWLPQLGIKAALLIISILLMVFGLPLYSFIIYRRQTRGR